MTINFRKRDDTEGWINVDNWFQSYIDLGLRLGKIADSQSSKLKRLLLCVPTKDFVSAGISAGLSEHKMRAETQVQRELNQQEMRDLAKGTHLRILLNNGFLGVVFNSFDESRKTLKCYLGKEPKTYNWSADNRYLRIPFGHPQGQHLSAKLNNQPGNLESKSTLWTTQTAPAALIIGDSSSISEELDTQLEYEPLVQPDVSILGDLCRMSTLKKSDSTSFINSYCDVTDIPLFFDETAEYLKVFDWIILNGNNPGSQLLANENLIGKRVLTIVENDSPRLQGKALASVVSNANNFNSVDARMHLTWNPLPGVEIWSWVE